MYNNNNNVFPYPGAMIYPDAPPVNISVPATITLHSPLMGMNPQQGRQMQQMQQSCQMNHTPMCQAGSQPQYRDCFQPQYQPGGCQSYQTSSGPCHGRMGPRREEIHRREEIQCRSCRVNGGAYYRPTNAQNVADLKRGIDDTLYMMNGRSSTEMSFLIEELNDILYSRDCLYHKETRLASLHGKMTQQYRYDNRYDNRHDRDDGNHRQHMLRSHDEKSHYSNISGGQHNTVPPNGQIVAVQQMEQHQMVPVQHPKNLQVQSNYSRQLSKVPWVKSMPKQQVKAAKKMNKLQGEYAQESKKYGAWTDLH